MISGDNKNEKDVDVTCGNATTWTLHQLRHPTLVNPYTCVCPLHVVSKVMAEQAYSSHLLVFSVVNWLSVYTSLHFIHFMLQENVATK